MLSFFCQAACEGFSRGVSLNNFFLFLFFYQPSLLRSAILYCLIHHSFNSLLQLDSLTDELIACRFYHAFRLSPSHWWEIHIACMGMFICRSLCLNVHVCVISCTWKLKIVRKQVWGMRRGRGRHGPSHVTIIYTSRLSEHYMLQIGIQYRVNRKLQFGFKVV